ncbi:MAG: helix-turn-helix transcriptional regulator [Lentisphaerae bacterium]|jgi:DNA-binding XRE family transcriptional regulator|nr:helix-turn-helix transcriptional regulator [Lentisphaerota bacterium]
MEERNSTLSELFRSRRREMSMTQAALAEQAGCKQSAVSMFEAGRVTALSTATIEKMAGILDVDLSSVDLSGEAKPSTDVVLKYCPVDGCPSNVPYVVCGRLCYTPAMVRSPAAQLTRCAGCGDLLQECCPNSECKALVSEGVCCPECGTSYVSVTGGTTGAEAEQWADEQRARIREIREMVRTSTAPRPARRGRKG